VASPIASCTSLKVVVGAVGVRIHPVRCVIRSIEVLAFRIATAPGLAVVWADRVRVPLIQVWR